MDEQQAISPEEARREKDAARKRAARAKVREQKIAKQASETYTSIEEWWAANRAKLTDDQRLGLEERQDAVLNLMVVMQDYTEGKLEVLDDEDRTWLAETIEEVKTDVAQYGQCCGAILNIPRLWAEENADLRARFEAHSEPVFPGEQLVGRANPASVLISYGYFVAVTERIYQDFRERFLIKRVPVLQYGTTIKCSVCGAEDHVSNAVAEDYRRLNRKYYCSLCWSAEQKSRKEATLKPQPRIIIGRETVVDGRGYAHPSESALDPLRRLWEKE